MNAQYLVALVHYSRAIKLFPEYSTCSCSVSLLFVVISLISPHSICAITTQQRSGVLFQQGPGVSQAEPILRIDHRLHGFH